MALLRDQNIKIAGQVRTSFIVIEQTLQEVVKLFLGNAPLKRLLYYTDKHALDLPDLTPTQTLQLVNENILIVPKLNVDPDSKPYVIVSLDNFYPTEEGMSFRAGTLSIDVFSSYDSWLLTDFKLRPWTIAGFIDGMINKTQFTHGIANFVSARQVVLNEHLGGCTLSYSLDSFSDNQEVKVDDAT